jgi:hypothetical protein
MNITNNLYLDLNINNIYDKTNTFILNFVNKYLRSNNILQNIKFLYYNVNNINDIEKIDIKKIIYLLMYLLSEVNERSLKIKISPLINHFMVSDKYIYKCLINLCEDIKI